MDANLDKETNSTKSKQTDGAEGEEEPYVTMLDVLEEEQKLEEDAFALLGNSDDKNCTYSQGYLSRQPLYACITCCPVGQKKQSGVCLACSYACHEGHELVELYTKRSFRCDCGNSQQQLNKPCALYSSKAPCNELNKYNHNFIGRYCICDRPYPDPERESGTMVQCTVCEDWFHDRCLETSFPDDNEFSELICTDCMKQHDFLWYYHKKAQSTLASGEENAIVDVVGTEFLNKNKKEIQTQKVGQCSNATKSESASDSGIENSCDSIIGVAQCKLKTLRNTNNIEISKGPAFWPEGWRSLLCKCTECLNLYRGQKIEFLYDEKDTVHHYEQQGKEKNMRISHYERGLNEITKMDRVQSIEAITECNNMTQHFKEFLRKFAEEKKVVRQQDIEEFFEELKQRKRQKTGNPYSF